MEQELTSGTIIQKYRKAQGLSIRGFTDEVNKYLPAELSYGVWSQWELDKRPPTFYVIDFLARNAEGWVKDMANELLPCYQVVEVSRDEAANVSS